MADTAGKKKKKATTVPLGEFLAGDNKKADWADVSDEDGDQDDAHHGGGYEDRRSDYRGDDRYGDRRGGYRSGDRGGDRYGGDRGGDRYGSRGGDRGGDRYNDRGDRYGGDRGGDRYGGERRNDRGRPRYDAPQKEPPQHPPFIAFVGNLDFSVDEPALVDFFSEHCQVKNARLLLDRQTGRSKGFGYVTFEDRDSLVAALEANGVDLSGRPLRVDVAEERNEPEGRGAPRGDRPARDPPPPSRADQVDKWERGKTIPKVERPDTRPSGGDRPRGDRPNTSQRKPLNLQPRSDKAGSSDTQERKAKSSPFGDAKPRDELFYQKKKEDERAQRGDAPSKKNEERGGKQNRSRAPPKAKEESKPVETANLYAVLEEED